MRTMMRAWMIAVFLAALAIASGCEDSPVTAGKDFKLILLANPTTVRVNPSNPGTPPTSALVATIVSDKGVPQKGFVVFFTSNGGDLASNTQGVTTDTDGNARDTLTVGAQDPAEISVTATSTTLTQTVKVTKTTVDPCAANAAPTAAFTASTPAAGSPGDARPVNLSSTSSDASPGVIKTYAWDCGNGMQGGSASTATCNYVVGTDTKIYTITLTVTDDGLGGAGPTYTCQKSSTITHPVTIGVLVSP